MQSTLLLNVSLVFRDFTEEVFLEELSHGKGTTHRQTQTSRLYERIGLMTDSLKTQALKQIRYELSLALLL